MKPTECIPTSMRICHCPPCRPGLTWPPPVYTSSEESLTQSSVLNLREGLISPRRVQTIISMLTTTSTSYLLLASLDTARRYLATQGKERIGKALQLADLARRRINEIPGLRCVGREILGGEATHAMDETKLIIHLHSLGITGYDAETWLREQWNIEVELSDLYNILCLITPGDSAESIDTLVQALEGLSREFCHRRAKEGRTGPDSGTSRARRLSPGCLLWGYRTSPLFGIGRPDHRRVYHDLSPGDSRLASRRTDHRRKPPVYHRAPECRPSRTGAGRSGNPYDPGIERVLKKMSGRDAPSPFEEGIPDPLFLS